MLTIKPRTDRALRFYGKLALLASVIGILLCSITIAMDHYLSTASILIIILAVTAVTFIIALPLFLLFYHRETGKTWIVRETGIEIHRRDREPEQIQWDRIREIFIKQNCISIFLRPDGHEENIYFMESAQQEEFTRFWHSFRTDHPERRETAPDDNKL